MQKLWDAVTSNWPKANLLASNGATATTVAYQQLPRLRRLGVAHWPQALGLLEELNRALGALAAAHGALVADLHARFLGHGLAAGDPTQPAARPADRGYLGGGSSVSDQLATSPVQDGIVSVFVLAGAFSTHPCSSIEPASH